MLLPRGPSEHSCVNAHIESHFEIKAILKLHNVQQEQSHGRLCLLFLFAIQRKLCHPLVDHSQLSTKSNKNKLLKSLQASLRYKINRFGFFFSTFLELLFAILDLNVTQRLKNKAVNGSS